MVRSARRRASILRFPGVTKRDVNDAATMRRPGRCGASERTTVSTSGSSGITALRQLHEYLAVFHFHRIGGLQLQIVPRHGASCAIELPPMKRASKDGAVESAMPQRSAGVRANAVDRVQYAGHIAHRYCAAIVHFKVRRRAGRQEFQRADFYESHAFLLYHGGRDDPSLGKRLHLQERRGVELDAGGTGHVSSADRRGVLGRQRHRRGRGNIAAGGEAARPRLRGYGARHLASGDRSAPAPARKPRRCPVALTHDPMVSCAWAFSAWSWEEWPGTASRGRPAPAQWPAPRWIGRTCWISRGF